MVLTPPDTAGTRSGGVATRGRRVRWLDPRRPDERDVAGAVAVLEGARLADAPYRLSLTVPAFLGVMRHGWDGEPPLVAVARDDRAVAGVLALWLPRRDNTHAGILDLAVDPRARRRGVGRALFEAGVERLRAEGRRLLIAGWQEGPAGTGFAAAMGLSRGSVEVERALGVTTVDRNRLAELSTGARPHAGAYEMIRLPGRVPADLLAQVATMTEAINDAPVDDLDYHDEAYSPERVRDFETAQIARGRRIYRVVARHRDSGVLAGHTVVGVEAEQPWFCWQFDTSVVRAHRGHRLGLVLKLAMLEWLAEVEPQVRTVHTGNAASNTYMVGVNELLGYRVVGAFAGWQRRLSGAG